MNYFSQNGRILIDPIKTDCEGEGNDRFVVKYYKIENKYTYSLQASLTHRAFAKFPHPNEPLFATISEAKADAYNYLETYCDENKLKKAFKRLNLSVFWQLDLFEEI